jgi:hypothetical protein
MGADGGFGEWLGGTEGVGLGAAGSILERQVCLAARCRGQVRGLVSQHCGRGQSRQLAAPG